MLHKNYLKFVYSLTLFLFLFFVGTLPLSAFQEKPFKRFRKTAEKRGIKLPPIDSINMDSLKEKFKDLPPRAKRRVLRALKNAEQKADSTMKNSKLGQKANEIRQQLMKRSNQELSDSIMKMSNNDPMMEEEIKTMEAEVRNFDMELAKQELIVSRKQLMIDALQMEKDSIEKQYMADLLTISMQEAELQENEIKLRETTIRWYRTLGLAALALLLGLVGFYLYARSRKFNKILRLKNDAIKEAQDKSEKLLLNILPEPIAEELKEKGNAIPKAYEQVSILFTDFKNFSQISTHLAASELVEALDYCFKGFDEIVEKYELEKIKTIGDAYMCAGGLPKPDEHHPIRIVKAALAMQNFLRDWKLERIEKGLLPFEARVGIHTGPLVAGVVGAKKFAYDVWGSTVNIAARMESNGVAGKVNISASTYELVKDAFACQHRGKVHAKNIGEIDMYFVE